MENRHFNIYLPEVFHEMAIEVVLLDHAPNFLIIVLLVAIPFEFVY